MMERIPPALAEGENEHVVLFHDESAFHANDYQADYWLRPGEQVLKKKEKGRLIMVSDFICEETGPLLLSEELKKAQLTKPAHKRLPNNARIVICPNGKPGVDAYWNMDQMLAQVCATHRNLFSAWAHLDFSSQLDTVLKMVKEIFPGKKMVFIFDNSSAHNSLAKNALSVTKMNVNPGGKAAHMRPTTIPDNNPHGHAGEHQEMQFPADLPPDHPHFKHTGKPKGMRVVLEERGYLTGSQKDLVGTCKGCKARKARKPHIEGLTPDKEARLGDLDDSDGDDTEEDEEDAPKDCCMQRILSLQSDFLSETSLLEKVSSLIFTLLLGFNSDIGR